MYVWVSEAPAARAGVVNSFNGGSLVWMVVLVDSRTRVVVAPPLPVPLFFTVTETEIDAPASPLVGLAVTPVTM